MFEGEKVRLRSFELSDLDAIMEHWNDLEMRIFTSKAIPDSRHNREEFIRNTWKQKESGNVFIFAIENKKTKEFLGQCGLYIGNQVSRSGSLGIAIHNKENWNKGYGTDAFRVLMMFGFKFQNLKRLDLTVYSYNTQAIHIYKKLGFKEMGRRRQASFINGKYIDEVFMDILREEWEKMV